VRLLVALVTALAGCSFNTPDLDGTFTCTVEAADCPAGTTCIDGRCRQPADAAPPPAGFRFRQKLTFASSDRGTVAGAPVLVALDAETFDHAAAEANGSDLRFFDVDDAPLPHEVERWDPAGRSLLWVKVPEVTGGSDGDHIWLYYGHDDPPPPHRGDVWSAYQAVYHMGEALADAGALGLTGEAIGSQVVAGRIGDGRELDGTSDHIVIGPDPPLLNDVPGVTLEAWVRPDTTFERDQVVVTVSAHGLAVSRAQIKIVPPEVPRVVFRTGDAGDPNATLELTDPVPVSEWTWMVAVADLPAGEVTIALNGGQHVGRVDTEALLDRTPATDPDQALIGRDEVDGEWFAGTIDEVRIAGQAMSSDWIALQYASMTGELISFGAAEPL
jgi:hypothetical protein